MATIANRSRFCVTVKNVDEATRYFSYDQLEAVEAYMQELRAQKKKYKPTYYPRPLQQPGLNLGKGLGAHALVIARNPDDLERELLVDHGLFVIQLAEVHVVAGAG